MDGMIQRAYRRVLGAVVPRRQVVVTLGTAQKWSPVAVLYSDELWSAAPLRAKLTRLVTRNWRPSDAELREAARAVFLRELFGAEDDLGEVLLEVMEEHWDTEWRYEHLTDHDVRRADALATYTVATRQELASVHSSPPLNLQLLRRAPVLCSVLMPMLMKVPVTSVQYFADVHIHFALNEIRRAEHPHAEKLVSLLYDTLFLQQKVALSLKRMLEAVAAVAPGKGEVLLLPAEIDAILSADILFVYEKASVEKSVALVGHTLELHLENKKTHAQRLAALEAKLSASARDTPYGQLLLQFVSADALDQLNAYRSGLLHKLGISDLQPHNYVGVPGAATALLRLFRLLHEQHAKNTAILLSALALLTDDLLTRRPPDRIPGAVLQPPESLVAAVRQAIESQPGPAPEPTAG